MKVACLLLALQAGPMWEQQRSDTVAALYHPNVVAALSKRPTAVVVLEWGDGARVAAPWTVIDGPASIHRLAGTLALHESTMPGANATAALEGAWDALEGAKAQGLQCEYAVLDLSATSVPEVTAPAVLPDLVALNAIVRGGVEVRDWYRDFVPGFVAWADESTYRTALMAKIVTEISIKGRESPPVVAYAPLGLVQPWGLQEDLQPWPETSGIPAPGLLGLLLAAILWLARGASVQREGGEWRHWG